MRLSVSILLIFTLQIGISLPFFLRAQTLNFSDLNSLSTLEKQAFPADKITQTSTKTPETPAEIAAFCALFQKFSRHFTLSADDFAAAQQTCARHADFFAWAGAHFNALGDAQNAAIFLERGLFLAPQRLDLHIEYAKALAQLGEKHAARALIAPILQRSDLPAGLAPELQTFAKNLAPRWQLQGQISAQQAWHNNVTHAPSSSSFSLSLPGGELPFTLAPPFRRQAGSSQDLEGTILAQNAFAPDRELQFFANARLRHVPKHQQMDLKQGQIGFKYAQEFRRKQLFFTAQHHYLAYGGQSFLQNDLFSLQLRLPREGCSPQWGAESERRRYPHTESLDGQFYALNFAIDCAFSDKVWLFSFKIGRDKAKRNTRAGGDHHQQEIRLLYRQPWLGGDVQSEWIFFRQDDAKAYHAWLNGGQARSLRRGSWRLDYQRPINAQWSWLIGGEYWRQNANLPLFANKNASIYTGLRYRF